MEPAIPWERSVLLDLLREEDGDVIVRLSPKPEEWLVLDTKQLAKGSEMLVNLLKPEWRARRVTMAHPVSGEQSALWVLSLIWDGETFSLSAEDGDKPLAAFPPPSSPMTPKYAVSQYVLERDSLHDGVHPSLLAAHDLFNMFALLYDIPMTLDHLPLHPQSDPEDVIRLGVERLASIITYTDYYCSAVIKRDRQLVLKDLLFEYITFHTSHAFKDMSNGPWLDLLRLSRDLKFPELYVFVLLEASDLDFRPSQLEEFAGLLGLESTDDAMELLRQVYNDYLPVHRNQTGMIVHIPLKGLPDFRVAPKAAPPFSAQEALTVNARILAGSIWEAHMKDWAYWRDLTWCEDMRKWEGRGVQWKQRFPRYGLTQAFAYGPFASWEMAQKRIVPDNTPNRNLEVGDIKHTTARKQSYFFFWHRLRPAILANSKPDKDVRGDIFDDMVVERFLDMAWERDFANRELPALNGGGTLTGGLQWPANRNLFVETVLSALRWYVNEAAAIFRNSLKPPDGLWDLSFTGESWTWANDSFIEGNELQPYLDDEETGMVGGGPPPDNRGMRMNPFGRYGGGMGGASAYGGGGMGGVNAYGGGGGGGANAYDGGGGGGRAGGVSAMG